MLNLSPMAAKLTVSAHIRRRGQSVEFKISTAPEVDAKALRRLKRAVPDELTARLPAGTYAIERTLRYGSRIAAAPQAASNEHVDAVIHALLPAMDELHRALRDMLASLPSEEKMAMIVREAYACLFGKMLETGTVSDIRQGFCTIEPCLHPTGFALIERQQGIHCHEGALTACGLPVMYVLGGTPTRIHLGLVSDSSPFRLWQLELLRPLLRDAQRRAEAIELNRLQTICIQEAARYAFFRDHLTGVLAAPESDDVAIILSPGPLGEA